MSTSLYRHFDAEGALLYVGISLSWPVRTKAHAHGSRWFEAVAKVEIEHFPTREAALLAEREAIKSEKPQFNIIHNRETSKPKTQPKRGWSNSCPPLGAIFGPDAIVGPALVYDEENISVIIAHGKAGQESKITSIVLGRFFDDYQPAWMDACDTVLVVRRGDDITMEEAREKRGEIIQNLKRFHNVIACETDISLAVANASTFPSNKSRAILDEVAQERNPA